MAENRFKGTSKNRFKGPVSDYEARANAMTHEQMVEAYRSLPLNDPFVGFLARRIAQPKKGESKHQAQARAYGKLSDDAGGLGGASKAAAAYLQGVPFVGEYTDEALARAGAAVGPNTVDTNLRAIREGRSDFAAENPVTSTALNVAGGLTGGAMMAAAAPFGMASTGNTLIGRSLAGLGIGAGLGATEGAVSGYGAGTDDASRWDEMKMRGLVGGLVGGGIGASLPFVAEGGRKAVNAALDYMNIGRNAKAVGLSKPSYDVLSRTMAADDSLTGQGAQRIAAAGPDGMVADAGPNARGLLDLAIQKSGPAGVAALDAVEQRARTAGGNIDDALDATLGRPQGILGTAKDISQSTAAAREAAYSKAYSNAINYADTTGRNVEATLKRVPSRILKTAIERANEAMQVAGVKNAQIMAQIAPDGSVTFKQMPNVQQLDELKKALGEIANEAVDTFGRPTGEGLRAGKLAREIRDVTSVAAPDYAAALELGGDKIAEDNALRLGTNLFSPSTTREMVADATQGFTQAERLRLSQGLRMTIDEGLANVKRAITDGNMDAREAIKAIKDFSSRANRQKLVNAIGQTSAERLLGEIDRSAMALDLRAGVQQNSKTFARTALDETIKSADGDGVWNAVKTGEALNVPKRIVQGLFGTSAGARQAKNDKVMTEIVTALTGPRGQGAQNMVQIIADIAKKSPQNAAKAAKIAELLGLTMAGPGYSASTQLIEALQGTRSRQVP